jgi:hypothetical protein
MNEADLLRRLSLADRLRVLAFDATLTATPAPLIEALWLAVDAVEPPDPKQPERVGTKCNR